MFIKILTLTCFISVAFAAPAPAGGAASAPTLLQHPLPIYLQSQPLLRVSPNLAVLEKSSPLVYSYPQVYSLPMNYYLLRQQGITGGEFADQVQDYFGMFGSQFQEIQNQSQGYFEDLQGNLQNSFGQGFELVSQGFAQGFEQVNQGWGDIQQQWAGGSSSKSPNLGDKSGAKDETRLEKNDNNKLKFQSNLLLSRPISLRYYDNRFLPYGFVRYGLAPLNVIPLPLQKQQEIKPAEQISSRSNEEVKMEKAEEPIKSEPEKVENEKPQQ